MSKNTGTSELINYFDLGANGDVGIAGSLDINTIANATTDTDTFLVSDTGIIKYRTGAQLLSDIGAAPAVAGGYVPYTGATTNVDLGVYNLTASAIIANGSGSNSGIVHLESNAIHSLVNGYGSIASGTTNQFNLYQTTGAGVFRGAILSLNSITEYAIRTFTLPDADGTLALTSQIPANAVGGTGTTNYLPKFTGASTIGNSVIQESSSLIGINVTPTRVLHLSSSGSNAAIRLDNTVSGRPFLLTYDDSQNLTFINSSDSGYFAFNSGTGASTTKMLLTNGGNLLVGTTSDNGARLQVSGEGKFYQPLTNTTSYLTVENNRARNAAVKLKTTVGDFLVGVGIGADTNQFQIYDNTAGANRFTINSTGAATFSSSVTASGSGSFMQADFFQTGSTPATSGGIRLGTQVAIRARNVANTGNIPLIESTATDAVAIASGGANVGIGTASPSAQLNVGHESHGVGISYLGSSALPALAGIFTSDGTAGGQTGYGSLLVKARSDFGGFYSINFFTAASANTPIERMRITSGGNVGIGTFTPYSNLEISKTLGASLGINHAPDAATYPKASGIGLGATSTSYTVASGGSTISFVGGAGMYAENTALSGNPTNLVFWTNLAGTPAERMRITSGGNVLINTTTDNGYKLNVAGNIYMPQGANREIFIGSATAYNYRIRVTNDDFIIREADLVDRLKYVYNDVRWYITGGLTISGSLSKGSGSFKIDHPLPSKKNTHHLVHSFIEGPQADNIYRGKVQLVDGHAEVNIDKASGMSEGTFLLLNGNVQCFTSNESGWTAIKGRIDSNILTIESEDFNCTDTVSWLVVGERHDQHMIDTDWTDKNGKVIVEPLKK